MYSRGGIADDGFAVKAGEFVFAVGVGIAIGSGPRGCPWCSGGIGVLLLLQKIAAAIVAVGDGFV